MDQPVTALGLLPVCADTVSMQRLRDFVSRSTGLLMPSECRDYASAEREVHTRLAGFTHRVCLVDLDQSREQAIRTIEKIHEHMSQDVLIFALSSESDPQAIIDAMRCGSSEYMIKPLNLDKLADALSRVTSKRKVAPTPSGRLITVLGAKGGTGVTALAAHLALDLTARLKEKTLLIDQHPALGDVSLYSGLTRHQYNFYELVNNTDRIDAELVKGFVLTHSSGLEVLDAPESLGTLNHAPPEYVDHTLEILKDIYKFVVVDCPPGLTDETIATVRHSDYIMLVLTAEMTAIRNTLRYIEHLHKLEFPDDRIGLVLNRHAKASLISDQQIERALKKKIAHKIPNCYSEVSEAINSGNLISPDPKSEFSVAVSDWANSVCSKNPVAVKSAAASSQKKQKGLFAALGF